MSATCFRRLIIVLLVGGFGCRSPQLDHGKRFENPPLILAHEAQACRGDDPLANAHEASSAAERHLERYVFETYSGVEAHRLFLDAATCFQKGGDSQKTQQSESAASDIARRVQHDFKYAWLRSELMLRDNKVIEAKKALRDVLDFLEEHQDHEFTKAVVFALGRAELEFVVMEEPLG